MLTRGKKMVKGLVSIIMPTYNCASFIEETIESIQAQTYVRWELLIVDDCSTDNTKEIAAKYMKKDSRIKYQCLEINSGAAAARNVSMKLAKGEYVAFCDSDDLWMPDKLEKQLLFMKRTGKNFTCTAYEHMG